MLWVSLGEPSSDRERKTMITRIEIPQDPAVLRRQLPLSQFRAALIQEQAEDAKSHAREAGVQLAEVLVAQEKKLEHLTSIEIDNYRQKYAVFKQETKTFLQAAKEALSFEMSWQYHS